MPNDKSNKLYGQYILMPQNQGERTYSFNERFRKITGPPEIEKAALELNLTPVVESDKAIQNPVG